MVTFPGWNRNSLHENELEWSHFPGWNRYSLQENQLNGHISLVGTGILYMRMN